MWGVPTGARRGSAAARSHRSTMHVRMGSMSPSYFQNKKLLAFSDAGDWKGMLTFAVKNREKFNDTNWSTLFGRLGRFGRESTLIKNNETLKFLVVQFESKIKLEGLEWMSVRNIANTEHGFGVMGVTSKLLFDSVENVADRITRDGRPQEISNIAYACAKLGEKRTKHFDEVNRRSGTEKIVRHGKPQEIANTVWAMATLGHKAEFLAGVLNREDFAAWFVEEISTQDISNKIWAMAALDLTGPRCEVIGWVHQS